MDEQKLKGAFGKVLRTARKSVGLSQEKLALKVGLDRTYISMLERGLRQPSLTTIFLICPALNMSSAEMVTRVQEQLK